MLTLKTCSLPSLTLRLCSPATTRYCNCLPARCKNPPSAPSSAQPERELIREAPSGKRTLPRSPEEPLPEEPKSPPRTAALVVAAARVSPRKGFWGKGALARGRRGLRAAHLLTQWAAVITQFLWMREPPQVWCQLPLE